MIPFLIKSYWVSTEPVIFGMLIIGLCRAYAKLKEKLEVYDCNGWFGRWQQKMKQLLPLQMMPV